HCSPTADRNGPPRPTGGPLCLAVAGAALIPVAPVFTNTERLALAGFLSFLVASCGAGQELPAAAAPRSLWCGLRRLLTGRLAATGRGGPPRGFLAGAEGGENDVDCLVAIPGLQELSAYH